MSNYNEGPQRTSNSGQNGISWGNVAFGYFMARIFGPLHAMRMFVIVLVLGVGGGIAVGGVLMRVHEEARVVFDAECPSYMGVLDYGNGVVEGGVNGVPIPRCEELLAKAWGHDLIPLWGQVGLLIAFLSAAVFLDYLWNLVSPLEPGE
jgi:hypothetical protein